MDAMAGQSHRLRRYGPGQSHTETTPVDDVIVLEGRVSVSADGSTATGEPGDIVYMAKGETVTVRSHAGGALTAYVIYPNGARTCATEPAPKLFDGERRAGACPGRAGG